MNTKNIKISDNKKIERFNKIKKNRKSIRFHIIMLLICTLVYIFSCVLDVYIIKVLKWYELNSIWENVFLITNAILFFTYLIFWCVKIVKLDKEKKQLLDGYKIIEIMKYISEVEYIEYAKYLGVKLDINYEEIKNEDIDLFNLTDKNRQKRTLFSKTFNIITWLILAVAFGGGFIWMGFDNIIGEIFGAISLIFGVILIFNLVISFLYATYLDKQYEKLILSYDYKKYLRYKDELTDETL